MQRRWLWLLSVFVIFGAMSSLATAATASVSVLHDGAAVMTEESSFTETNSKTEIAQVKTANAADEDGARIGYMTQPIDGEMKQAATAVGEVTTDGAANYYPATATTEKSPVDAARSVSVNQQSLNPTNPQDAAVNFVQSEVWAPNDIAGEDTTPAVVIQGKTYPIGREVAVVIKWTTPTAWTNA